ncbi:putative ABC transporter [Pseudocercospora fijiensis CIRAD86]|uniref:Putative ABC transporter n=1 Tax=Pseudocercospora fijiensis (strain CIRAD86) TaxID=383855 RepID=M2ZX10_PSEFD|nr:putative ABC transporter [Pseudocercospora fijiensis CIRAD86]EME83529.1 putative ABC transporter [Pseudocercospora fijiensis CIRAD86]
MDDVSIITALTVAVTLFFFSNFPLVYGFLASRRSSSQTAECYIDEDGEASKAGSSANIQDKGARWSIGILSVAGLGCGIAGVVLNAVAERHEDTLEPLIWCQLAGWILAIAHSILLFLEPSMPRRFMIAHCSFWTSIGIIILAAACDSPDARSNQGPSDFSLQVAITTVAGLRAICCILVPRRPDVYHEGHIVDQEHTVSMWSRLTFSYVGSLVWRTGKNQGKTEVKDFPQLPAKARSANLYSTLEDARKDGRTLFRAMCTAHFGALMLQLTLAIGSGLLSFGPQLALYGILRALETQSLQTANIWAAVLGVTMFLSSSVTSWLWWITYSRLAIPLYSELLALLYAKGMRRKIVHRAAPASEGGEESDDKLQEQGEQETLNLVTVDTKRISDAVSYQHLVPSSVTQFIFGCAFLWVLIGWQSLLAGLGANLLLSPISWYIAKHYGAFQKTLMATRDQRTAIVHEVTKNIRQIKFSSVESPWEDRVLEVRGKEMRLTFKGICFETAFQFTWTLAPLLLSAVALTVYALIYGNLEASTAFTAVSTFGLLEVALSALPHIIIPNLQAKISVDRIDKFLASPDRSSTRSFAASSIVFDDATIAWPVTEGSENVGYRISRISVEFPSKGLSVVTGRTGTGKSLLLSSILGECDVVSGSVKVPESSPEAWREPPGSAEDWIIDSAIAYVAQSAWTDNGTVRQNIVFGLPFDRQRYQQVIFSSGLEKDLEILEDGDRTDIGANGVNLSGGQRLRVSFARALYSRAGILIMDDIFSALDAGTGHHVYEHGLTGPLAAGRTRILGTHHIALVVPQTDFCVVLADQSVACSGSVPELKGNEMFDKLLVAGDREEKGDGENSETAVAKHGDPKDDEQEGRKFSPEEERAAGSVPLSMYWKFFTGELSPWLWALGVLAALLFMLFGFGRSYWLNIWTRGGMSSTQLYGEHETSLQSVAALTQQRLATVTVPDNLGLYIGVYVGLSLAAGVVGTLRFMLIRTASLRSSQALFKSLLSAVLAAPLRWVDTVPLGRVLNRFTADVYTMDNLLGSDAADVLLWFFQVVGVVIASIFVSLIVLVPALILSAGSMMLAVIYLRAAREAKRLESVSRSPILEQFTSSLLGLTTIRAFDQTRKYTKIILARIDGYAKASWHLWLLNWWLQLRINLLGSLFLVTVAFLVVKLGVSASLAGFAISSLLQYGKAVSDMIRFYANFEMGMNATERVIDYADIRTEPKDGDEPPASWPSKGTMVVDNLTVSYAPELPPVLKKLSFTLKSNERMGVVGRTGAGKSTLALALFRFMNVSEGQVTIDGLDSAKLKLHALRRALAIVPQQPTLFTGTIKSNLDPFDWYSEAELNDALERVHLGSANDTSTSFALNAPVSEGGENFSQGQRQLLCLARAILQQPKIMILDEATSSVDMETDGYIQQAIRSEFGRNMSSLLVIAHRLSTIADFDRILVMDHGEIVELGTPKELLAIEKGVFRELVNQSGEKALLEKTILGEQQYSELSSSSL